MADELLYMTRKTDEILEHVTAILRWLFEYTAKHRIPLDDNIGHHIKRIKSILIEMNKSDQSLLSKVHTLSDESFHDDDPTETTQNSCLRSASKPPQVLHTRLFGR